MANWAMESELSLSCTSLDWLAYPPPTPTPLENRKSSRHVKRDNSNMPINRGVTRMPPTCAHSMWRQPSPVCALFAKAKTIALVQDNLNIHSKASLYEAFPAAEPRRLVERFEWHYTPKHGIQYKNLSSPMPCELL
jgi:hypothetical protein